MSDGRYLAADDTHVHLAPGRFGTTTLCGIPTEDVDVLFTPAQAVFFGANQATVAEDLLLTVCLPCAVAR